MIFVKRAGAILLSKINNNIQGNIMDRQRGEGLSIIVIMLYNVYIMLRSKHCTTDKTHDD